MIPSPKMDDRLTRHALADKLEGLAEGDTNVFMSSEEFAMAAVALRQAGYFAQELMRLAAPQESRSEVLEELGTAKSLLGRALIRLRELGDTSFDLAATLVSVAATTLPEALADQIERALDVLQPLCTTDYLFVAPNAAPGCELRFSDLRNAVAALRASPPEGMVLVPREPTEEMMNAAAPAFKLINGWCAEMQLARGRKPDWPADDPPLKQAWRAMLNAAASSGEKG